MKSQALVKKEKNACKLIIILIVSIVVANLLMVLVYSLPTDRMFSHAKASSELFSSDYIDMWAPGIPSTTLSYPTDAIMINNAIYSDKKGIVYNSMMNPRYEDGAGSVVNSLSKVLSYEKVEDIKPKMSVVTPLDSARDDNNPTHEIETMYYPKYWHGYLLFLKPMLLLMDISEIKIFMMTIQILLAAATIFLIGKKIGRAVSLGFLSTLIILNPVTVALTFQENTIYVLSLISMILVLVFNDKLREKDNYGLFFMIWGCTTCFLDFLTYPLVTLGFSLCIVILLNQYEFKESVINIMKCSMGWSVGYVGLWVGKFVSCTLLTDFDLISYSMKAIMFRMGIDNLGSEDFDISAFDAIKSNILPMCNWINLFIVITIAAFCLALFKCGYRKRLEKAKLYSLLLLSVYPIIWYVGTKNHSYIHYYMTYRELAITWFCMMSITLYKWEKEPESKGA